MGQTIAEQKRKQIEKKLVWLQQGVATTTKRKGSKRW